LTAHFFVKGFSSCCLVVELSFSFFQFADHRAGINVLPEIPLDPTEHGAGASSASAGDDELNFHLLEQVHRCLGRVPGRIHKTIHSALPCAVCALCLQQLSPVSEQEKQEGAGAEDSGAAISMGELTSALSRCTQSQSNATAGTLCLDNDLPEPTNATADPSILPSDLSRKLSTLSTSAQCFV
jgi:hypothetical protein